MNPLHLFFHWPDGGVWSNIVASLVWTIPGYLWGRHHFQKLHRHHDELMAYHKQLQKKLK